MNDPASHQPAPHDPLTALRGQFPGWEAWVGVSGLLYARRPRSSPPIVVRDATAEGLAAKVAEAEGKLRWTWTQPT
jgi:hypothetical protein